MSWMCYEYSIEEPNLRAHLLFSKSRTNAHDVNHVALYHAHIHEVATAKGIEFLALAFSLLLLLGKALMAGEYKAGWMVRPVRERSHKRGVTNSSCGMALNCTASSLYSLRQAGQRPLRFCLI